MRDTVEKAPRCRSEASCSNVSDPVSLKMSSGGKGTPGAGSSRSDPIMSLMRLLGIVSLVKVVGVVGNIPGFVNGTETVTQQIFRIQTFNLLHLFGQVTFWGVIAENMLDRNPDAFEALEDATVYLVYLFKFLLGVRFSNQYLPNITVVN